jgi:hypothetical protein
MYGGIKSVLGIWIFLVRSWSMKELCQFAVRTFQPRIKFDSESNSRIYKNLSFTSMDTQQYGP